MRNDRPARLTGLQQASFILEQLAEGRMPPQIINSLDNDSQLVEIWIDFLVDIKWIVRDGTGVNGYFITEKGERWLAKPAQKQKSRTSQLSYTA